MKVAVVTGSSSGIGFHTALELAREGFSTFATMRDHIKGKKILEIARKENLDIQIVELDVNNTESVKTAITKIVNDKKRIDVLVNNAGYGIFGAAEDTTIDEYKSQFETNFFGAIRMVQQVAPIMRKQSNGYIVNISSVAGKIGFPGSPAYISSKFALEGFSESLRYEIGQFGVKVIIIEPGVVKTNFFNAMKVARSKTDSPYTEITHKVISGVKMMAELGTEPIEVAKTVINAIKEPEPLPRYIVGNDAIMFLEAKKIKTDIEFENYLKKELFSL